jgi:hypothetical protein
MSVIFLHARLDEDGQKGSGKDRPVMFVAVKAKEVWRIVAGQMTKESLPWAETGLGPLPDYRPAAR